MTGADASERFGGEGKAESDGPGEASVNVDGAAAHARHLAGLGYLLAAQAHAEERLLGTDVLEHAEHFDAELFDLGPLENGASHALLAGTDFGQRIEVLRGRKGGSRKQDRDDEGATHVDVIDFTALEAPTREQPQRGATAATARG